MLRSRSGSPTPPNSHTSRVLRSLSSSLCCRRKPATAQLSTRALSSSSLSILARMTGTSSQMPCNSDSGHLLQMTFPTLLGSRNARGKHCRRIAHGTDHPPCVWGPMPGCISSATRTRGRSIRPAVTGNPHLPCHSDVSLRKTNSGKYPRTLAVT